MRRSANTAGPRRRGTEDNCSWGGGVRGCFWRMRSKWRSSRRLLRSRCRRDRTLLSLPLGLESESEVHGLVAGNFALTLVCIRNY